MRKLLAIVVEVLYGLPLVAVSALGADVLLQRRSLAYLLFPLITGVGAALGFWRGRAGKLPPWQLAVLLDLPLLLLVGWFLSSRVLSLLALPLLSTLSVVLGLGAAGRRRAGAAGAGAESAQAPGRGQATAAVLVPLLVLNLALAAAVPRFVSSLIVSRETAEPAAPYRLAMLDGGTVPASQLRGRVVVLDFWATWCGPCRRELPEIQRLSDQFAGRRDVVICAVDGASGDTPEQARQFFRQHGFRLDLAYDYQRAATKALSVHGFPTLLVLDRAGRIRLRHVGYVGAEDLGGKLTGLIERLLAESSS
jgi:thiol-disulfide isomerase/thioredoxin